MSLARIRMQDIAQRANVSQSTVSCVLSGKRQNVWIGEQTRERVLKAAQELGYRPNDLARAIVTGKSQMLGFLGFTPEYESSGRMLEAALGEAEALGYTMKVLHSRDNILDESMIDACIRSCLSGIITLFQGDANLDNLREQAARYRIQVVLVDNSRPHSWGIRVVSDDLQGVGMAVDHLADLGHTRIAFLSVDPTVPMLQERIRGYRVAMDRRGLPMWDRAVTECWWGRDPIEAAVAGIVNDPVRPTAIVCALDDLAMFVVRGLRTQGVHVPRDLSVVGFADTTMAGLADPPLTTIAQPFREMGIAAVRHIVKRIEDDNTAYLENEDKTFRDDPIQEVLPTRLIIRDSTAPPSR